MHVTRSLAVAVVLCFWGGQPAVLAQTPPAEAPPLWDAQVGAAFVGTSGNSDITTIGADFSMHRRWPSWQIESTATAVRTSDHDIRTAERYVGAVRGQRKLTTMIGLTAGERLERDPFAGIDVRSILDGGLSYALVRGTAWTLDGVTAMAWNHEATTIGPDRDDAIGVLQLLSKTPFSAAADSTQRFTLYLNFSHSSAYRAEAEVTAQAAMNSRLGLKVGYLWRRSNEPVARFLKNDSTLTASVVLRWRSATPAP